MKMISIIVAIGFISLQTAVAAEEQYGFEKIVLGKWGDKPGEFGLGQDPTVEHGIGAIMPSDIDVDDAGNFYVMDRVNSRIQVFGRDNKLKYVVFDEGQKEWLSGVTGIVALKDGNIYLNNFEKKQFGLVKNKKISIFKSIQDPIGYDLKKSCDDKIILGNDLFDVNLNKIPNPPLTLRR